MPRIPPKARGRLGGSSSSPWRARSGRGSGTSTAPSSTWPRGASSSSAASTAEASESLYSHSTPLLLRLSFSPFLLFSPVVPASALGAGGMFNDVRAFSLEARDPLRLPASPQRAPILYIPLALPLVPLKQRTAGEGVGGAGPGQRAKKQRALALLALSAVRPLHHP